MQHAARVLWQDGFSKRALLDVDGGSFRCEMGIGTPGFADSVAPCKEGQHSVEAGRKNKDERTAPGKMALT